MKSVAVLLTATGLVASTSAWAQQSAAQSAVNVRFDYKVEWATRALDAAIRNSLSVAPLKLSSAITPDTIVISIPDGISRKNTESETDYHFTVVFTKNGDKIGESDESCSSIKLSDCSDQLASDTISANNASLSAKWSAPQ